MKKLLCLILTLFVFIVNIYAATFKVSVKGEVYLKTPDGEMIQLEEEDNITDEDTIIVGQKSSISFYIGDQKILIRNPGAYKVADLLKR